MQKGVQTRSKLQYKGQARGTKDMETTPGCDHSIAKQSGHLAQLIAARKDSQIKLDYDTQQPHTPIDEDHTNNDEEEQPGKQTADHHIPIIVGLAALTWPAGTATSGLGSAVQKSQLGIV